MEREQLQQHSTLNRRIIKKITSYLILDYNRFYNLKIKTSSRGISIGED
jgi:hypothetical protein